MSFDLEAYLSRIGSPDTGGSDGELLRRLHFAHLKRIPFENTYVLNGRGIDVSPEAVFDKIVIRGRGGYCFEMNCLFCEAVKAAGMEAAGVLARVNRGGELGFGGYSHRMNIVRSGPEKWLCDVGFGGDGFTEPLRFEPGEEQASHGNVYRIVRSRQTDYAVQILRDGGFEDMLGFDDRPANEEDFVISSFYTSRFPGSVFRHSLMLNIYTDDGRYSVFGDEFTERRGDTVTRRTLNGEEMAAAAKKYFGLTLD